MSVGHVCQAGKNPDVHCCKMKNMQSRRKRVMMMKMIVLADCNGNCDGSADEDSDNDDDRRITVHPCIVPIGRVCI